MSASVQQPANFIARVNSAFRSVSTWLTWDHTKRDDRKRDDRKRDDKRDDDKRDDRKRDDKWR